MKSYFKSCFKGISLIFLYFFFPSIIILLLNYIGIYPDKFFTLGKIIYLLGIELSLLFIVILGLKKDLINNFKDFKKNFKEYFKKYHIYWFVMLFLMFMSSMFVSLFSSGIPQNEELIRETLSSSTLEFIYILISSILIAPFMEEFIFRGCVKKIVPLKWIFIIISGLFFGSMHVVGLAESLIDYLYILPYSIPGFVLAYTYCKSDNIFVPIGIHMFHNGVMLLMQVIMMLGGNIWKGGKRCFGTSLLLYLYLVLF